MKKIYVLIFFYMFSISAESIPQKINNYLINYYDNHFASFGTTKLSSENESFIRNIIEELGMSSFNIDIRAMSSNAKNIYGEKTAFCVGVYKKYLFVSESFFNELSYDAKRFLIGHELGHHYNNDILKKGTLPYAMLIGQVIIAWKYDKYLDIKGKILFFLGTKILTTLGNQFFSRNMEYAADKFSVEKLDSSKGAIEFLEVGKSYDSKHNIENLLSSHPSVDNRIAAIKKQLNK